MYLTHLKTLVVTALRTTFDATYPNPDFADAWVSIEYPVTKQAYPSIWVDYADTGNLVRAGVDHKEEQVFAGVGVDGGDVIREYTRWKFTGVLSLTVVALSSLERDRFYDEVVRVIAFGPESDQTARFRKVIEDNDLLAANVDFDTIEPAANAAAPGTPWGTDEIVYERGINLNVLGEFVSDPITGDLVPLSGFEIIATEDLTTTLDEYGGWPDPGDVVI